MQTLVEAVEVPIEICSYWVSDIASIVGALPRNIALRLLTLNVSTPKPVRAELDDRSATMAGPEPLSC